MPSFDDYDIPEGYSIFKKKKVWFAVKLKSLQSEAIFVEENMLIILGVFTWQKSAGMS